MRLCVLCVMYCVMLYGLLVVCECFCSNVHMCLMRDLYVMQCLIIYGMFCAFDRRVCVCLGFV